MKWFTCRFETFEAAVKFLNENGLTPQEVIINYVTRTSISAFGNFGYVMVIYWAKEK